MRMPLEIYYINIHKILYGYISYGVQDHTPEDNFRSRFLYINYVVLYIQQ